MMEADIPHAISSRLVNSENSISNDNGGNSFAKINCSKNVNSPIVNQHLPEGNWSPSIASNRNLHRTNKIDRMTTQILLDDSRDFLRSLRNRELEEDLSSSDSEFDISDSDSSWGVDEELQPPQASPKMSRDRIEEMDRLYAHALQFREMQAQNLDLVTDGDLDNPQWPGFYDDILQFDTLDLSDVEDSFEADTLEPPYPVGRKSLVECAICTEVQSLWLRPCCDIAVCSDCLSQYFTTQVNQANVRVECPSGSCNSYVHRDEVLAVLDSSTKEKYYRFLVNANQEPHIKSCPRCNFILTLSKDEVKTFRFLPKGYRVQCSSCYLVWCFPCQAPWHENIRCRDFRKGDKLLKDWSKKYRGGQQNAQRCPKCKVYIQRATGCDHMICSRCSTNFCYRCGERFRHIKFIGDHYSRLSVFGCRYRFMPERPVKRKLIRGAILGGKLLAAPVVAGLAVGGAALVVGFGTIAAPFYGGYKLHKHLKERKRLRQRQAASQTGQVGHFLLNGSTLPQYYEDLLIETVNYRRAQDYHRRLAENADLLRPRVDSLETLRLGLVPSPRQFIRMGAPLTRETIIQPDDQTQVTALAQSDEDRLTVTRTEFTRQQRSSSNNNNYTETEYPMEVLNVVTNYEISTISAAVEGNSNNSTRTPRTRKTRKTSRTQALKSSEKGTNGIDLGSPKASVTDNQSGKEIITPAKGKSKDTLNSKDIPSVDLDKSYSEDDTLSKDPNNLTKNVSKDFENKTSSHVPWINIVCGKINRDKDSLKEDAERKISSAESVSKKGSKKILPPLQAVKLCHERAASPSADLDCNLKVTRRQSGRITSDFEHHTPKQDNLGAFGTCSEDEDDWSLSSTNQSPVNESKRSYYEPVDSNLDYIDDDFVSEYSEMTSL